MFDVANDRLNYSELLEPNIGYKLDFAVGLTYSLDLEALLGVPVALGLLSDNDEELMKNEIYLLEAIRKSSDKIAIFCNAGSIAIPQKIMSVYSLLENSVFEVKLEKKGNFHPKLWFIKYTNDFGESYIKLLILSRNLTFDNSIDLCVEMQGKIREDINSKEKVNKNKSLSDMLEFVANYTDEKCEYKKEQIGDLAKDILKVQEFSVMHPFESYEFLPLGVNEWSKERTGLFEEKNALLIVSPFLSEDMIGELVGNSSQRALITRKESITEKVFKKFLGKNNNEVYVTKEEMTDNEDGVKQDIHAKMYFTSTDKGNYLYIGSANASYNAFNKNIEFLLKLRIKPGTMEFSTIFNDLINRENSPFEKVGKLFEIDRENKEELSLGEELNETVYNLNLKAEVKKTEIDGRYKVVITTDIMPSDKTIKIAPLQKRKLAVDLKKETIINDLLLKELSEFYILSLGDKKIIVKIKTTGILLEERDNAIYKGIIDTKSKFISYVSFILSDDYMTTVSEFEKNEIRNNLDENLTEVASLSIEGLYEKMLKIFYQNPQKIEDIDNIIRRLDDNVISEEFKEIHEKFIEVMGMAKE